MHVREALEQLATGALRRIAVAHGLPADESDTRTELIELLSERLADRAYLQEQVSRLAADEQAALVAARASGGEVRGFLLDRDQPGAAAELVERGLLFRTFAAAGPRRGEVFFIPDELFSVLPAPPEEEPPPTNEASAPPERRTSDPVFSLFALASTLQRSSTKPEEELHGWSEEPGGFDVSQRGTFLEHLGVASGLLVQHGHALLVGPTLARLLNDPPRLAERLWRTYRELRGWSELAEIDLGIEHAQDAADASLVRAAVIEAVERLPEGNWIELDSFTNWLRETSPDLIREQLDARGRLLLESLDWDALERPLLRLIMLGPLYWLGQVACSVDGARFARRALSRASQPEACWWPADDEHTRAELVAPARAELGTLLEAERYVVLEERGRWSKYRLVQQHVAAALGSGGSIDDCRRLLERLTQAPLPERIEERLAAWSERFGAVTIRPSVLVEARTEAELDAALGEETVKPFVRHRLGPSAAEVAAADALELAAALRDSGHLPRVDAALRLGGEPRRGYQGLIDEQVLEFLLVSLLAFQRARPERLAELEGALSLIERLERQFPPERLRELRAAAASLAGQVRANASGSASTAPRRRHSLRRRRAQTRPNSTE
ncbi:MAG TPA: hypothetical protein VFG86_19275 [Chloroflexota bacterium]|nr:hypothetical protein [Chloroflexota bacterium]